LTSISPIIKPQLKKRVKKLALKWKGNVSVEEAKSLESLGFLQLVASYGLASSFELNDIIDVIISISRNKRKQVIDLCMMRFVPLKRSPVFHGEHYEEKSDDDGDDDGEGVPFDGLHDMFEDLQAPMHNDNLAHHVEHGELEDMAPGTASQRLRAQSTSQLAVNTGNDSSAAACKKKRGKAVNNEVIDYKAITGQKPRIEIHPKYAEPVGRWSSQFVREIGLVARQHGPLTGHDWSKVEDDARGPLRDCVMDKLDIDMHLPHVKYVVDKILGERLRNFRCVPNSHYKKFENDRVARRHPYGGLTQEKWDACCDGFRREEFMNISDQNSSNRQNLPTNHCGGSKPFVKYLEESCDSETQQLVGMIELYRRSHFSSKGWTSLVAEENYDRMQQLKDELEAEGAMPKTEDEILNTEEVQRRRDEEEFQRKKTEEAEKCKEELKAKMVSQRNKIKEMDARQERFEAWMLQFNA
ncbi:hypothetical protein GIB67_016840, partial [Kingdonia uniflora]